MELKFILESLLFSAQKPVSVKELRDIFAAAAIAEDADETAKSLKKVKEDDVTAALEELAREHETAARSYRLACVAGAWQFVTQPEFSPWLKALVGVKARPSRLSQAALETLAIVAYLGPCSRPEITRIRGVAAEATVANLLERGLISESGRDDGPGGAIRYRVTALFERVFGLENLAALPRLEDFEGDVETIRERLHAVAEQRGA